MNSNSRPKRASVNEPSTAEKSLMNRTRLSEMILAAALSDAQTVGLLMEESGRPCGVRTLKHWL